MGIGVSEGISGVMVWVGVDVALGDSVGVDVWEAVGLGVSVGILVLVSVWEAVAVGTTAITRSRGVCVADGVLVAERVIVTSLMGVSDGLSVEVGG